MIERIKNVAEFIKKSVDGFAPEVGVVLGSGLGNFANTSIDVKYTIEYHDIPEFPVSTVEGHSGRLIFGYVGDKKVVAMQGRFHFYEGYPMDVVTLPIRVMKLLGVETLFVSNAAGGVNTSFKIGDLMIITDHINTMPNPLIGKNLDEFGPRFQDMNRCYDPELCKIATDIAERENIKLQYGVYVGLTGPSFETHAEYRYVKAIGGDAVGMSTVPEVIVARHSGLRVFGVSVVTNCGLSGDINDHKDVQEAASKASANMSRLFTELIKSL